MKACLYSHLANHVLRRDMVASLSRESGATSEFLGYLAEFDARKLYAPEGYPSLYAFCLGELHLSEDSAYKRIRVARAARQFPAIYAAIAEGRLNLSAVVLLAPYLSLENSENLLTAAAHKSNFDIQELLARRFPRPDLPTRVEPVMPVPAASISVTPACEALSQLAVRPVGTAGLAIDGPDRAVETVLDPDQPSTLDTLRGPAQAHEQNSQLAARPVGTGAGPGISQTSERTAPRARLTPLSPERYGVQFTMRGSTREKLREVQDLLGHKVPAGDLDLVLSLALDALREKLERARRAEVSQPRKNPRIREPKGRHVPSEIEREVRQRDGNRCTFVSDSGKRCESRRDLELDHAEPFARGGKSTAGNLRLRCRTHNQLEGERVYGENFMKDRRHAAREQAAAARAKTHESHARSKHRAASAGAAQVARDAHSAPGSTAGPGTS